MTKKQAGCGHGSWHGPLSSETWWKRCSDCREYLGLGPSADDSESVRVEIRAADMNACHETGRACTRGPDECHCFDGRRRMRSALDERDARRLARCIATHDSERGDG